MSIQRNDWSLQRKGIIDQDRHKERVKEAIRKNLGSIVSNEAIIMSDGKRTVKVPIRSLDEYKFRFDHRKRKHVGQGDGKTKVGDVLARENPRDRVAGRAAGKAPPVRMRARTTTKPKSTSTNSPRSSLKTSIFHFSRRRPRKRCRPRPRASTRFAAPG